MARKQSLVQTLNAKAVALREEQLTKSNSAAALASAAAVAAAESDIRGAHAEAVEEALTILADAGVTV